jgi:murein DD-endopeptidase MepM/ murein hydrolase activator NlpD
VVQDRVLNAEAAFSDKTSKIDGIGWIAIVSLGLLLLGMLFIAISYLTYKPDSGNLVAKETAPAFVQDLEVLIIPKSTRDILGVKTSEPVRVAAAAPASEPVEARRTWPRLKPQLATPSRPIAKSIDMNATYLAENVRVGFAMDRDFTGGVEPLFTKYEPRSFEETPVTPAQDIKLKRGETMSMALARAGVSDADRDMASTALGDAINLRSLRAGTTFQVLTEENPKDGTTSLISLTFPIDRLNRVHVTRDVTGNFVATKQVANTTKHYAAISGTITDSLFGSAERAGAPREIVAKLANLFLYDIDFARQIRKGDKFEAVYEVLYDDNGEIAGYGDVVFGYMSWLHNSRDKGYYRFSDNGKFSWFDTSGKSARRLLMKTPIEGARITSGFGNRRHPVLGYTKKHKGVDFGARRGTPIMAAGDGTIQRANRFGSFGNYVRIKHANGYETAYAHLKGFGKGIKKGRQVRQGQIIGYVGTTGRSTGPHLHYEVLHNGKQVNPMNIKVATGKVLKGDNLEEFTAYRDWVNRLRHHEAKPLILAQN